MKDYYAILNVSSHASEAEIKKAFRILALQFHPDRSLTGDHEKFMAIQEAYSVLSSREKRQAYDNGGLDDYFYNEEFVPVYTTNSEETFIFTASKTGVKTSPEVYKAEFCNASKIPLHTLPLPLEVPFKSSLTRGVYAVSLKLGSKEPQRTFLIQIPQGVWQDACLKVDFFDLYWVADRTAYFVVKLAPHDNLKRYQHHLYYDLVVTPWDVALKRAFSLPLLEGKTQFVFNAANVLQPLIKWEGKGLYNAEGTRGEFCVRPRLFIPSPQSVEEEDLWLQLAAAYAK